MDIGIILLGLALLVAVAAFNLVSTLVMTVTDQRADIAILRTLGSSPRSIMAIFVVQGALFARMGMDVVSPTVEIRMVWSYLAVPTGGLFMGLYSLERLVDLLRGRVRP